MTTVALFLLAALDLLNPMVTKAHADTINDVSSVNTLKATGGDLTEPLGVWNFNVEANLFYRMVV